MEGNLRVITVLLISTLLGAFGQLFLKYSLLSRLPLFLAVGLAAYFVSTVLYFYLLSRTNLSWIYGMGGLSYIFAVVLAATVIGEPVPIIRWIGTIAITLGFILVGLT